MDDNNQGQQGGGDMGGGQPSGDLSCSSCGVSFNNQEEKDAHTKEKHSSGNMGGDMSGQPSGGGDTGGSTSGDTSGGNPQA